MPDFPYVNARVRAMRSRLLPSSRLEELVAAPTMDAFLQSLSSTPYGTDLQEALSRRQSLQAVDEALARNLRRATRAILRFADGRPRALIEVVLVRWDLENLRGIVRGKHAGRSAEEIVQALVPAGTLGDVVLKEMAGFPEMTALAGTLEALGHPLAGPLAQGIAAYAASKDLMAVELRLDQGYAEWGLRRARGTGAGETVLREILRAQVDAANIKTALKLAAAGPLPEDRRVAFYIAGGAIVTEKLFAALSDEKTQGHAWQRLRVAGFPLHDQPTALVAFERELDYLMIKNLARRFRDDPLGVDVVVGYLAMKSVEVANLRLIARGKALGLPREQVRREMVLV